MDAKRLVDAGASCLRPSLRLLVANRGLEAKVDRNFNQLY